tara:strand:+ start:380 stop:661 length:282 start_codon:yes stop_codon:yes gene_type:complete
MLKLSFYGGFTGGELEDPVEVKMCDLSEKDFDETKQALLKITNPFKRLEKSEECGDSYYILEAGKPDNLIEIYQGQTFEQPPKLIHQIKAKFS